MADLVVKPGDVLGAKYKVERILGSGGMGIVVAARHIDLGQRVALKFMLREAMKDPTHAERFLREAKAAVQLKSIHTTQVLDVGRLQNGEPYMVMEYLQGHDLDAELHESGPASPHTAVDYILQATEALAEAHGLGLVHRDVKLKNLFLTQTVDGRPLVKVLDFGLAKTIGGHGDVSLTATNSVFGSPQYMSPEQMRSAKDVDFRSDIWSLGVCLYELLTGKVPFDAPGVAEICAMVLKDPVPPPSQYVLGLPVDLEAVVLKCLEKDANKRYQSVAELGFALQNYAQDENSARRILTVMQSAKKADIPTIMTPDAPMQALDAGPRTMNAWDSAVNAGKTRGPFSRNQVFGVFLGLGVLAAIGVLGIALVVGPRLHKQPVIANENASVAPPAATDPPPLNTGIAVVPGTESPPPSSSALAAPPTPDKKTTPPGAGAGTAAARPPIPGPRAPAAAPPSSAKPKPKNTPGNGAEYM